MDDREVGAILRSAREAAGLSLAALANRTFFSKGYLANIETGKRHATVEVVAAYERELGGDDVDRRELLAGLVAGTVAPRATLAAVSKAFETALAEHASPSTTGSLASTNTATTTWRSEPARCRLGSPLT